MTVLQELIGDQSLAVWLVLGAIGFLLTWKGANVIESTTSKISDHFGVSQAIQGGLIVAAATSFPELAIIVISVLVLGDFGVGAGALIGTAVFNILVIPAAVAITSGDTTTTQGIVYRDAIFYMVAVLALFGVIALGVLGTDGRELARITPQMGVGLLVLYGVYVILLAGGKSGASDMKRAESTNVPKQAGLFAAGLVIVLVGVESMVTMTVQISDALDAPSFLISVTVLSVLSSFPDLLVGVKMGEAGDKRAAIANVFGTNTFNLVAALPIGVILAGGVSIGFLTSVPLLLFLFYTTLVVVVMSATEFEITTEEGYVFLAMYVAFLGWMTTEALGITALLTEETLRSIVT
ncbi:MULTISPECIES: sodium:calcium antiporter [unclassified Halorubrum]|uniref:sodium:calcium antiporter n=1 Tax=unclassified Halorubrum TaxID=2642239 RepID=UPI000B97F41F|nr:MULTISPECIES: sodium:calcium antiporter [unclassified Halorubrum]OYR42440.1 Na+/Ca2+-exchanging protein [Halorubrum sp. Eb13]OYR42563.1 Na+/Ca2+-exchanging protein [Halorubrum sp. Hd13]OYR56340.1 Na+/Ca2+-exchanging protein [Halorubrum sp. Ea1]